MFPSELINPKNKGQKWHRDFVMAAWKQWDSQSIKSFNKGQERYEEIRAYANGTQSIEKYKKMAEITEDDNQTFMNIDWTPIPIIPKYLRIATDRLGKFDFRITAQAVDPLAKKDRIEYENAQKARIKLNEIKALAGIPYSDKGSDEFDEPQDFKELNIKMNFGYKHNMAIDVEKRVDAVFQDCKVKQEIARQIRRDGLNFGAMVLKDYYDPTDGKVKVRKVKLDNFMCSPTLDPYLRDLTYAGEVIMMTLGEIREQADEKDISDSQLVDLVEQFSGKYGNPKDYIRSGGYHSSYDSFEVPVLDMEFLTVNKYGYEKRIDKRGNGVLGKYDTNKKKKSSRKYYEKSRRCRHQVKHIIDTELIFDWGEGYNKRKNSKKWDTELTYHGICPEIHNMETRGLIEQMIPHVDQIHTAWYKLQNTINMARPKGIMIELGGLEDIDLGGSGESMSPQKVLDMFNQTGLLVYRKLGLDGEMTNYRPIEDLQNGIGTEAQEWFAVIESHSQKIKELIGFNDLTDGSTPDPKTLNGVAAMAQEMTNNALHYIIDAERNLLERVADSVAIRVHDAIAFMGSEEYDNVLSPSTLKSIKEDKDHIHREYKLYLEYDVDPYDEQKVAARIEKAIADGQINIADATAIDNIKNLKEREMVLAYRIEKNMILARERAKEEQEQNAQVQIQSSKAAEEEKRRTKQMEIEADIAKMEREWALRERYLEKEYALKHGITDKEQEGMKKKEDTEAIAQIQAAKIKKEPEKVVVS